MYTHRKDTRKVMVKDVQIGGNNEVVIQSMTTTRPRDIEETIKQIQELEKVGCQIVRLAVPTMEDAIAIKEIKQRVNMPIVADIHFDYKLALAAIESGVDKIRINPGNIGKEENVRAVVDACKAKNIPIRIGVNSGSLEKEILQKYGHPTAEGMIESAKHHVKILEELGFYDIIISLKASDIFLAIDAYRLAAKTFDYPLHLGITESGTKFSGTIKSSGALGVLLHDGIGSTIRISLSTHPTEEIKVAKELLKSFNLYNKAATLISCPTCGRIQFDLFKVASEIEKFLEEIDLDLKVAVMGCAVNGPGEAREADIGLAGGNQSGLIFKKGEIFKKVQMDEMVDVLKEEIMKIYNEKKHQ